MAKTKRRASRNVSVRIAIRDDAQALHLLRGTLEPKDRDRLVRLMITSKDGNSAFRVLRGKLYNASNSRLVTRLINRLLQDGNMTSLMQLWRSCKGKRLRKEIIGRLAADRSKWQHLLRVWGDGSFNPTEEEARPLMVALCNKISHARAWTILNLMLHGKAVLDPQQRLTLLRRGLVGLHTAIIARHALMRGGSERWTQEERQVILEVIQKNERSCRYLLASTLKPEPRRERAVLLEEEQKTLLPIAIAYWKDLDLGSICAEDQQDVENLLSSHLKKSISEADQVLLREKFQLAVAA